MAKKDRPSGLIKNNPDLLEQAKKDSEELKNLNSNFQFFQDDYSSLLVRSGGSRVKKAYLITFKDNPSLVFISFNTSKEKAKSEAVLYFRNILPEFSGHKYWEEQYIKAHRKRIPQFDKYAIRGKVPIKDLLKLGMSFPCAVCGKHSFNFESVQNNECFIVEDGFEINPFTEGILVCTHCYYKKCIHRRK